MRELLPSKRSTGLWSYSNHGPAPVCPVVVLVVVVLVVVLGRRIGRVEVTGASMVPTLFPSDRLLVWRTRRVRPGMLAVVADPRVPERLTIKRVVRVWDKGVEVRGDNPAMSTDSRTFGVVPWPLVRGRVPYRYWPPQRTGALPPAVLPVARTSRATPPKKS